MVDFGFHKRIARSGAFVWLVGLLVGTGVGLLLVYLLLNVGI